MQEESQKIAVTPTQNITPYYSLPWIFQHQDLLTSTTTERPWDQRKLVNKINHLNFIDSYVFILCRHQQTGEYVLMKACPQPCVKDELICRSYPKDNLPNMTEYNLDYLMIDDGLTAILAPVQLVSFEVDTLKLSLPHESRVIRTRKTRRYHCQDISCEIIQDDFNAQGTLVDFTPSAFGIKLTGNEKITGFDENNSFELNLKQNGVTLYSGSFRCIRNGIKSHDGKVVFALLDTQMTIFPKRNMRNPRQHITPSFAIIYKHPFFQKKIERDILEISTSGFSVLDSIEEETLLPGMIIPKISIVYAGIVRMDCSVRVLYRHEDKNNKVVQCGLAITDMDVQSYSRFNHILGVHLDNNARVSIEVDMESLWEFFFDTGFIYGEKYEHLYPYRKTFNETYQKLYQDNPDIARHFVYEKNGKIYGHMSMVHAYHSSWLIHHFAARPMENKIAGLMVLRQIIHYINGFYRFPSGGMDYVMAYYQPENEAMDAIFGGFVDYLSNRQGSSLDLFSYIMFENALSKNELPSNWKLHECTPDDLKIMKDFYENSSGGLMFNALGLDIPMKPLRESFAKAGFIRNCQIFCLCFKEEQVAFFVVDQSNLGLNLCDLLNCIKIVIVNDEGLKWDIILAAINKISVYYKEDRIPLLIYPANYLSKKGINADKNYLLWIIKNDPYVEQYAEYMASKFRMRYRIK